MVPDAWDAFKLMLLALGIVTLYLLPTYVLIFKGITPGEVFVRNLLLGWTVIGWAVLLVQAVRAERELSDAAPGQKRGRRRSEEEGEL